MNAGSWPCPLAAGGTAGELAISFDSGASSRLLIVPALFDEANRMRRFTVEVMRRLHGAGIASVLPDLPGSNESLQPLREQTPAHWRDAMSAAAAHFGATHVLGIRGGALLMPTGMPGWNYAPVKGATILRQMIRARIVASREAGVSESQDALVESGMREGLELVGHHLGPASIAQFQILEPENRAGVQSIDQDLLGGAGLWLRAEPGEDRTQADALAAIIAIGLKQ